MTRRYASSTKNTEADITGAVTSDNTKFNGADVEMLYTSAIGGSYNSNSIGGKAVSIKNTVDSTYDRVGAVNSTLTSDLNGKIGTDTEMADVSLFDMIGYVGAVSLASKLAGEATVNDTVSKNWNTVNDSPDSDGGLVVTLGTAATKKKLHSLLLDVSALTNGAAITVKLFQKINDNADVCVYEEDYVVNTDPDGLWIVNGTLALHDTLKVVMKSDTSESVAVEYTAVLEAM